VPGVPPTTAAGLARKFGPDQLGEIEAAVAELLVVAAIPEQVSGAECVESRSGTVWSGHRGRPASSRSLHPPTQDGSDGFEHLLGSHRGVH